jgi:hypothetical protein
MGNDGNEGDGNNGDQEILMTGDWKERPGKTGLGGSGEGRDEARD